MRKSKIRFIICFVTGLSLVNGISAQFVHPGLALNKAELDKIKADVNAGIQPRKSGWDKMMSYSSTFASLSYTPHPVSVVQADGSNSGGFTSDILAAYTHALIWNVTGNQANANKAIEIMNAWSGTLTNIVTKSGEYSNQYVLVTAWAAEPFCEAAEIIRYSGAGWAAADITKFENMMKNIFYPKIHYHSAENGNWEASQLQSMIAIGVFCNDKAKFDEGINYFRGTGKGALGVYIYASGECQETCRDQFHSMMGLGELVDAAEIAWKQGIDLYNDLPDPVTGVPRLVEGLEYTASVTNNICMSSTCGSKCENTDISSQPMWEKAWNHYGNRMKRTDMQYTKYNAEVKGRPAGKNETTIFAWQTLTHSNMNISITTSVPAITINSDIKIYPNPANDFFIVEGSIPDSQIELYDVLGKKILTRFLTSNSTKINISELKQGIYFYKIRTGENNSSQTGKLIKE